MMAGPKQGDGRPGRYLGAVNLTPEVEVEEQEAGGRARGRG